MAEVFSLRVSKDYFVFCCAHFITMDAECERLHGHNYRAGVELEGLLDGNGYIFDFVALKARTREIVDVLDHHLLLATRNAELPISENGANYSVRYREKTWSVPKVDCVLLDIANTTTELIAEWFGRKLFAALRNQHGFTPSRLRVEIEEVQGQCATWTSP